MVEFKDFRSFLRAALEERRRIGRHLGVRMLSQAIGVSESHLSNVVRGRRGLDPAIAGDLAQALGLEGPRWRNFVKLVELDERARRLERMERHWATAEVADAEQPDGDPPSRHLYLSVWELARDALLAREPGTVVRVSLLGRADLKSTQESTSPMEVFRGAVIAGVPTSDAACVTLDRPALPCGQEPAQVVLQQAILVTPWPEPS